MKTDIYKKILIITILNCFYMFGQKSNSVSNRIPCPISIHSLTYCKGDPIRSFVVDCLPNMNEPYFWCSDINGSNQNWNPPVYSTNVSGTLIFYAGQYYNNSLFVSPVYVIINEVPTFNIANIPICNSQQGSIDLNTLISNVNPAGAIISWFSSPISTTPINNIVNPSEYTTYWAEVNVNGCKTRKSCFIERENLSVNQTCGVGSANIIVPQFQYNNFVEWYNSANTLLGNNSSIQNLQPGNYYVKIININYGCTKQIPFVIVPNDIPAPTVTSRTYCQNEIAAPLSSSVINSMGSLKWYSTSIGGVSSSSVPTPNTSIAGTFYYYVSQTINGCESLRSRISVKVNPAPQSVLSQTNICGSVLGSATVVTTGKGSFTYNWVSNNVTLNSNSNSNSITGLVAGNYYVIVKNNLTNCSTKINFTILGSPNTPTSQTFNLCQGDNSSALQVLPNAGFSIKWYTTLSGGTALSNAPTPSTTNVSTLTYYVSQTNGNCESLRVPIVVNINAKPSAARIQNELGQLMSAVSLCRDKSYRIWSENKGINFKYYWSQPVGQSGLTITNNSNPFQLWADISFDTNLTVGQGSPSLYLNLIVENASGCRTENTIRIGLGPTITTVLSPIPLGEIFGPVSSNLYSFTKKVSVEFNATQLQLVGTNQAVNNSIIYPPFNPNFVEFKLSPFQLGTTLVKTYIDNGKSGCNCFYNYYNIVPVAAKIKSENLNDLLKKVEFAIYPNPSNGNFTIDFVTEENYSLILFDMLGKEVFSSQLESNLNTKSISLDQLNNGIYIYKILDNNYQVLKTDKLIISK